MKKLLKWIAYTTAFILTGLFILGTIIENNKSPEQKAADAIAREQAAEIKKQQQEQAAAAERLQQEEQEKSQLNALPTFTAANLASDYEANTVAADQTYKGKRFKVTGVVSAINTDITGDPYVTLRGGVNQFMEPQFSFEQSELQNLAKLKKGVKVTLACTGKGDIAKTPTSGDCKFI